MLEKRFGIALRKKSKAGFRGYPLATVAYYGPDASRASKAVIGLQLNEASDVEIVEKYASDVSDVRFDAGTNQEILGLIRDYGVRSVIMTDGMIGCPHEEGIDYPEGEMCPQCPYWANHDRFTGEKIS